MRYRVEQSYFNEDVRPEWLHKARLLTSLLEQAEGLPTTQQPKDKAIHHAWWTA